MTTNIEQYLSNGCMRCKLGGTPQCKVHTWRTELQVLRQIVLETHLNEEMKWGVPVYTYNGKNIVAVVALKESVNLSFFKGVLLSDKDNILKQQGNQQSNRVVSFTGTDQITKIKDILVEYIFEAVTVEESGAKVTFKKNPEPTPDELLQEFEADQAFKTAFYSLTPGRQRGYIIYFSQPKQSKTRIERIKKYKDQIFEGIGLTDKYRNGTK